MLGVFKYLSWKELWYQWKAEPESLLPILVRYRHCFLELQFLSKKKKSSMLRYTVLTIDPYSADAQDKSFCWSETCFINVNEKIVKLREIK